MVKNYFYFLFIMQSTDICLPQSHLQKEPWIFIRLHEFELPEVSFPEDFHKLLFLSSAGFRRGGLLHCGLTASATPWTEKAHLNVVCVYFRILWDDKTKFVLFGSFFFGDFVVESFGSRKVFFFFAWKRENIFGPVLFDFVFLLFIRVLCWCVSH